MTPSPILLRLFFTLLCVAPSVANAQEKKPTQLKEEMRVPWTRSHDRFIRHWQVLGEIPLTSTDAFTQDPFAEKGGETSLKPLEKTPVALPKGATLNWRAVTAWGDAVDLSDGNGLKRDLTGYAFTTITRSAAGKARLSLGSDEGIRAWVNGSLVLDRHGSRPLTFDEDLIDIDMNAGENSLLVKVEQHTGPWIFAARVLESGSLPSRVQEISPSFTVNSSSTLIVKTDVNPAHAADDHVAVQIVAAGGSVLAEKTAPRGESLSLDFASWPDGPYEIRCSTRRPDGLRYTTHLAWYKGDAIAAARELVAAGAKADLATPLGLTTKMLADMVLDRLGKEGLAIAGNPWWAIHSPLMEYQELWLESGGAKAARERAYGFVRLAWHDDIDGSPQFTRAYLPGDYDRARKWPLVIKLHGYNPANPEYVRWWAADSRHNQADVEYGNREGVIYMEPHGRGNTQYLGLGDQDVLRNIELAKQHFSVDEDRIYLCGDSMGGWGTWNVGTRHPELFAAIAPIYGGVDYHSSLTEEQLAALTPLSRFLQEKSSSWAMADGLLNLPIFVHHGDVDAAVNTDFSRYGVRMLQRWGYNIRYFEMPGYGHEDLNRFPQLFDWFLTQRRDPQPRHVRLRSAELQNATSYWVTADQFDQPNQFMVIDAEITGRNTLRVDSQNILALTLSPGSRLIDASQPVQIVWNGVPQSATVLKGKIVLHANEYSKSDHAKNARIAGPIGDIFNTPFAIVTGTASADPAMNEVCRTKAEALVALWKDWQRQPPRSFNDSELTEADASRYSLILIGGPDTNLVARRLASRLPLQVDAKSVSIGGRSFDVTDARVQMILPHPLNAARYVLVVAATSAPAMDLWTPSNIRGAEFDFTINDAHVPNAGQQISPTDLWVAGGWFDRDWARDDSLVISGNAEARAKGLVLGRPIDLEILDTYAGTYDVPTAAVFTITRTGAHLMIRNGDYSPAEMIPAGEDKFYVTDDAVLFVFEKDATGRPAVLKIFQNGREYAGKRTN